MQRRDPVTVSRPLTSKATGLAARVKALAVAKPGLAIAMLAVAGVAAAAVTITYSNSSTLTTSVTPPPVQFLAGDDAGPSALTDYVTAYAISTNKTSFSSTVKGVPEASLAVGSFFKLQNVDDASRTITLSTSQVTNAYVTAYTVQIYNSANVLQGTLTLTAASPSVTVTMPAGSTYSAKLTLTLATGAGANNVALSNSLALTVA